MISWKEAVTVVLNTIAIKDTARINNRRAKQQRVRQIKKQNSIELRL